MRKITISSATPRLGLGFPVGIVHYIINFTLPAQKVQEDDPKFSATASIFRHLLRDLTQSSYPSLKPDALITRIHLPVATRRIPSYTIKQAKQEVEWPMAGPS
ncbi:hypothetical protein GQ44DRAFT_763516 [Phaeosphaeriaceae sp. PMI808]|nr:hypothetical protein GQ44DRAFT_763516 [Phaeosphaeriaceae sp. PMI808]